MKKKYIVAMILVSIVSAIVSGVISGFVVGYIVSESITEDANPEITEPESSSIPESGSQPESDNNDSTGSIIGIYYTEDWAGESDTLIFYEDGTYKHPGSDSIGTWKLEGNIIKLHIANYELEFDFEAYIVEGGLILLDVYFEKM